MNLSQQWLSLTQLLGIQFTSASTVRANCPLCRSGYIQFYQHPVSGSRHFATTCCLKTGNMLDLTTEIRQLPSSASLQLIQQHAPLLHEQLIRPSRQQELATARTKMLQSVWDNAMPLHKAIACGKFAELIKGFELHFNPNLSWHEHNLNEHYRWITKQTFNDLNKKADVNLKASWSSSASAGIIYRSYSIPGELASLSLLTADNRQPLKLTILPADNGSNDPGYALHSEAACSSKPLVAITDPLWLFRANMYAYHYTDRFSPFVGLYNESPATTQNAQLLFHHHGLLWLHKIDGYALRVAIRANMPITTFGASSGALQKRVWDLIDPFAIHATLQRHALPWQEHLAKLSQSMQLPQLNELVESANLSPSELEMAQAFLPTQMRQTLQEAPIRACPPASFTMTTGTIHQEPHGWVLQQKNNAQEVICSKPWRIVKQLFQQDKLPLYLIEIFDKQRWHSATYPKGKFQRNPLRALGDICDQLQLTTITMSSRWVSSAVHIATQLNPIQSTEKANSTGFDNQSNKLNTTNYSVCILSGEVRQSQADLTNPLLPLAQNRTNAVELSGLLRNKQACDIMSAFVYSAAYQALGYNPPVITAHPRVALSQMLDALGVSAKGHNPLAKNLTHVSLSSKQAQSKLLAHEPYWATTRKSTAYWLAAIKPTIFLTPPKQLSVAAQPKDALLQTVTLLLLSHVFKLTAQGVSPQIATYQAWQLLTNQYRVPLPEEFTLPKTISHTRAVAYWTSKAAACGMITPLPCKPTTVTENCFYPDRNKDYFLLSRDSLNRTLASFGYHPWDFSDVLPHLLNDDAFHGQRQVRAVTLWKFDRKILSQPILEIMLNHKTTLRRKHA